MKPIKSKINKVSTVNRKPVRPLPRGQRIFTCGHSSHHWVLDILKDLAKQAGISGHHAVGTSSIGGSRVIQHWDVPAKQNKAKQALRAGTVDVLTLSCMTRPDEGIRRFAKLAVEHNPHVRVTLQELWLPKDRFPFDPAHCTRKSADEFNGSTMAGLKKPHKAYFKVMEDYVSALNTELGKQSVFIVPDAQAALALRERIIAGTAPGLKKQSDLFTDAWGHPSPPLQLLSAYCHFSVIYRRSPVGLTWPGVVARKPGWGPRLNRLLQQLAWESVTHHPLSGIKTHP
ncbi:MAG: hypothetical protein PHW60_12590 [Kiritimatiellae bacterium]|nr:hypothetical protein [Kiritimatiellia bacterium]